VSVGESYVEDQRYEHGVAELWLAPTGPYVVWKVEGAEPEHVELPATEDARTDPWGVFERVMGVRAGQRRS
jgi:hypothetical protein